MASSTDAKTTTLAGDPPAPRARALSRPVVEATRVVIVGVCLGIALGILRGVPEIGALRAVEPTTCTAPVIARPDVHWIEQDDAHALISDVEVSFVDARPREVYEAGHIAGALNVPMDTGAIDDRAIDLVRGARVVITYCDTGSECASSRRLAGLLAEAGLPDVRVMRGGMPAWLENGYPAEAGPCRACP